MNEYFNRIHLLISTLAALVVTAVCVIRQENLYWMAMWVSATIAMFYVIGLFTRSYIITRIFPPPLAMEPEEETEDSEDRREMEAEEMAFFDEMEMAEPEPDEAMFEEAFADSDET
jgi:uncharacterized protein YybS (DUF2232 family)